MKQLTIEHLAPYLPYGLKCQYEGIVNGKEISKQRRDFQLDSEPFFADWENFKPIEEIRGLKLAPLKSIRTYKHYWVAMCGIYNTGQKNFYNGIGLKPILRPLSDLTKEIEHNGERFVPTEYFEIGDDDNYTYEFDSGNVKLIKSIKSISKNNVQFDIKFLPFEVVNTLISWHFDVFGLIDNGLAIDINTVNTQ